MSVETWITLSTSVAVAIIAVVSALISVVALKNSRQTASTQVFLDLRRRYLDILRQLPDDYHVEYWVPVKGTKEWNAIAEYWYQTFNEWYITKWLYGGALSELWTSFYQDAIRSGLRNKPLREVLIHLLTKGSSFSAKADEFERDICELSSTLAEELSRARSKSSTTTSD